MQKCVSRGRSATDLAGSSNVVLSEPVGVHGFQVGKNLTLPVKEGGREEEGKGICM